MSPEQTGKRLIEIADEIDSARLLVEVALMAVGKLSREESGPLAELLDLVSERLRTISEELHPSDEAEAA